MAIPIKYVGSAGTRIIDDYQWSAENGYIQEVDVETAANLLSYPRPDFEAGPGSVSASEAGRLASLLGVPQGEVRQMFKGGGPAPKKPELTDVSGVGEARAAELEAAGVASVEALAGQDEEGVANLATNTGASRPEIERWVAQAKEIIGGNS